MITLNELRQIAEARETISTLPDDILVDQKIASEVLAALGRPCAPRTLHKLRCISSTGPRFVKAPNGRVRYSLAALKEFASASI